VYVYKECGAEELSEDAAKDSDDEEVTRSGAKKSVFQPPTGGRNLPGLK
jgi:hypothetical protein